MRAVAAAICVLMLHAVASAQETTQPASTPQQENTSSSTPPQPETVPRGLPVSLDRIRSQLADMPSSTKGGLKIQTTVEVVGVAPPIELWDPAEAKQALTGPAPFGPPTQKDFLELTTPQEFKPYPFDMNALMRWLADKLGGEKKAE